MRARLLYYLCTEHYLSGNLRGVLAAAAECVAIAVESQHPELASWGLYYLGAAHYARNEFAAAEPHLLSLIESKAFAGPVTLAFGVFALALIRLAQGDAGEATDLLAMLAVYLRRIEHKLAGPLVDTFQIELALRQGLPSETLRPMLPGLAARLPRWYFYAPLLTEIKLRIAEGLTESLRDARQQLDALEDELRRYGVTHTLIDALLLQAIALAAQGDERAALERLAEALKLAAPGGFVRNFVDLGPAMRALLETLAQREPDGQNGHSQRHIDRVLAAFGGAKAAPALAAKTPSGTLVEPLTEREMELLQLVATDLSPVEIAERLSLSPTTVRTHIRNIYGKLDAHSRFEAVMRAKELGLL
jgi:LuxR family maltose regulon positive regulatory protein